uniref:Uncharacterized protein n=1 Tax=Pararge aegeria TaxID=116150 RepID=S4NV78_9NEOP
MLALHEKSKCRFVMCAFPCGTLSSKRNKQIYNLNLLIYNLTCRHSDAVFYFDINKSMSSLLSRDSLILSKKSKHHLASLLAYNLNDTVTSIVTKSIDTSTYCTSSTTNISNIDPSTCSSTIINSNSYLN